jgi:hypothetical protein
VVCVEVLTTEGNDDEVGFKRLSVQAPLRQGLDGPVRGKEVGEATSNRSMQSADGNDSVSLEVELDNGYSDDGFRTGL